MAGKTIHGANAVHEALRSAGLVNRLYLAKDTKVRDLQSLIDMAREQKVPFDFVPQAKLNELAGTLEHQGVVAAVSPTRYLELDELIEICPPKASILVLDRVQHPKNVGMLVRTALGAGTAGIVLTSRGGALLDDSVVRASAGTVLQLPIAYCGNVSAALRSLQKAGFWVYGLDAAGQESVFDVNWADRCALVLGNETEGLRPGVRKACDVLVKIPLAHGLDSLNVAVAGGIALFQVTSGRSAS